MISTVIAGLIAIVTACFIGVIERALSPDLHKFPCINPFSRITARFYTVIIFARGCSLINEALKSPPDPAIHFMLLLSWTATMVFFGVVLWQVIKMRLPDGMWLAFQNRQAALRRLTRKGAGRRAEIILAAQGAMVYEHGDSHPLQV
jgi:hypothetical protein